MDVLHAVGRATAHEVRDRLSRPPSYSATRALLAVLVRKGHVKYRQEGPRYVYAPAISKEQAGKRAVVHLLDVFFGGSAERAVSALLDASASSLSADELDKLSGKIAAAKKEGR